MLHLLLAFAPWVLPPNVAGRDIVPARVLADGTYEPAHIDGQLLVRFGAGVDGEQRTLLLGSAYRFDRSAAPQIGLALVQIVDGRSIAAAIGDLEAKAGVLYAVPDHVVTYRDTYPNDASFGLQYGKDNTGQTGGDPDADIDAPAAWDLGTGSADFAVAIVDSGTEHAHPDLVGNRWENAAEVGGAAGVDDDGNGYVDDLYGWNVYTGDGTITGATHGTHVAGIAAAQGNNGIGVAGVSWDSQFVSISGSSASTSIVVAAYSYALTLKGDWLASGGARGARIVAVNSSFGVDFADCSSPAFRPWNDMYEAMGASGILSIAATMNNLSDVDVTGDVPTACTSDYLVAVTATNDRDERTFSAFGLQSIDLGAPGALIRSTVTSGGYGTLSGTSMAAPQVTGAVALLHSVAGPGFDALRATDPAAAALEIKRILVETVDVVPTLNGVTASGGRVNLRAAAEALSTYGAASVTYCDPAPPNSTGLGGAMSFEGSASVGANHLDLVAEQLPVGSAAMFLVSRTRGLVVGPGGSAGNLCLGGAIGRFAAQLGATDATGRYSIAVDLARLPQPGGAVSIQAGERWHFQCWYRDAAPSGALSHFTDALSVSFW